MQQFVILSPSKEMDWREGNLDVALDEVAEKIVHSLKTMNRREIETFFSIGEDLTEQVLSAFQRIGGNKGKLAIDTYQGIAFRQIDKTLGTSPFAEEHLRILSALYGPVSPTKAINPYRLDFSKKLSLGEDSLQSLQKINFTQGFLKAQIFNLASSEFAGLIDKKKVGDWVDIAFYKNLKDKKKAPSATSKKLRGQLANHLLKAASFDRKTFASFSKEGYRFSSKSTDNHYIYYLEEE